LTDPLIANKRAAPYQGNQADGTKLTVSGYSPEDNRQPTYICLGSAHCSLAWPAKLFGGVGRGDLASGDLIDYYQFNHIVEFSHLHL